MEERARGGASSRREIAAAAEQLSQASSWADNDTEALPHGSFDGDDSSDEGDQGEYEYYYDYDE